VSSQPNSSWGWDLEGRNENLGSTSVIIASFSPLPRGLFSCEDTQFNVLPTNIQTGPYSDCI